MILHNPGKTVRWSSALMENEEQQLFRPTFYPPDRRHGRLGTIQDWYKRVCGPLWPVIPGKTWPLAKDGERVLVVNRLTDKHCTCSKTRRERERERETCTYLP